MGALQKWGEKQEGSRAYPGYYTCDRISRIKCPGQKTGSGKNLAYDEDGISNQ